MSVATEKMDEAMERAIALYQLGQLNDYLAGLYVGQIGQICAHLSQGQSDDLYAIRFINRIQKMMADVNNRAATRH